MTAVRVRIFHNDDRFGQFGSASPVASVFSAAAKLIAVVAKLIANIMIGSCGVVVERLGVV